MFAGGMSLSISNLLALCGTSRCTSRTSALWWLWRNRPIVRTGEKLYLPEKSPSRFQYTNSKSHLNTASHPFGEESRSVQTSLCTSCISFSRSRWAGRIRICTTLHPGDVLWMGTEGADGDMVPGDVIEVEISGIGTLRNYVVAKE